MRFLVTLLTLFFVSTLGFSQTLTTITNFDGISHYGQNPVGTLVQGLDGNFYGANTNWVFGVTPAGSLSVLRGVIAIYSGLALGTDGDFYGQQDRGGHGCSNSCGTVFRLTPDGHLSFKNLTDSTGDFPLWSVALAPDGGFYGSTEQGGTGCGTVYRTKNGEFNVVLDFNQTNGCMGGGLVAGTDLKMYGVAQAGGIASPHCPSLDSSTCGLIYTLSATGTATVLYEFDGSPGWDPGPALVEGNDGNYYGVTPESYMGFGTVFQLTPSGSLTYLHMFTGSDGSYPFGPLALATDGNFYGTTEFGGSDTCDCGTIFRVTAQGQFTTLINFDGTNTGSSPYGLVQGTDGALYGVTNTGGVYGYGTVYKLDVGLGPLVIPSPRFGATGAQVNILGTDLTGTTAVNFNGTAATFTVVSPTQITATVPAAATTGSIANHTNGSAQKQRKLRDFALIVLIVSCAQVYGSARLRRFTVLSSRLVLVFFGFLFSALTTTQAQQYQLLHRFTGTDGGLPENVLVVDKVGDLLGTTLMGGTANSGTVFKLDSQRQLTVLYSFSGGTDGKWPFGIVEDASGDMYGAAALGGQFSSGVIFKIDTAGNESVLYNFTGGADGSFPTSLLMDAQGRMYGIAVDGGNLSCFNLGYGCGVVFKIDTSGNYSVLHTFQGTDGYGPSGIVLEPNGDLIGTTAGGGDLACPTVGLGCGVIFGIDAKGSYSVLYAFSGGTQGAQPSGPAISDASGNLYGGTTFGGDSNCKGVNQGKGCGVIYALDSAGNETVLHTFLGSPDGEYPEGSLLRDRAGNLYGVTASGGDKICHYDSFGPGCGTVFRLDSMGNETVLYPFKGPTQMDGKVPFAGLVMDSSGNLYGTTAEGGSTQKNGCDFTCGTIFELSPN